MGKCANEDIECIRIIYYYVLISCILLKLYEIVIQFSYIYLEIFPNSVPWGVSGFGRFGCGFRGG